MPAVAVTGNPTSFTTPVSSFVSICAFAPSPHIIVAARLEIGQSVISHSVE